MDREEVLNNVVEAFQRLQYGDIFTLGMAGWVDSVYDAHFNLVDVPFGDLQTELEGVQVQTLLEIANGLYDYFSSTPAFGQLDDTPKDPNILTVLDKAQVPLKEFFAALTAFIYAGLKSRRSDGVATRGCLSGTIFFLLCMGTKGSVPATLHNTMGISSLYIQPLYAKSLDILGLPDSWTETKKAGGKKGRTALTERQANGVDDAEDLELYVETNVQWEEAQPLFLKALTLFARNMDLDAFPFHLGRPCRILANTWKRDFGEQTMAFDPSPHIADLFNRKQHVAKWFSLLIAEKQKNLPENLEVVLWAMEPGVLRLSETLTSYQTLTKAVETYANNVAQFCNLLLRNFSEVEECQDVIERFMQDLFYLVPDTAEYRRRVAETYVSFMDTMKPAARNGLIRWIAEEADADRARSRGFALHVMHVIWTRDWNDVSVPYLKCTTRQAVVLEICMRRLPDKSAKIRGCAASIMSSLLQSDPHIFDHLVVSQEDETTGKKESNRVDSLFSLVLAGISDISVVSRKAYLQMLGRLLISNFQRFDQDVKDSLLRVAQDPAKTMRTSIITVICDLIKSQDTSNTPNASDTPNAPNTSDTLVDLWIRGVFRLYMDSEQTVKDSVATEFRSTILDPIMNEAGGEGGGIRLAWRLVECICRDEFGEIRLLRQMLSDLEKAKIVTTRTFSAVQQYLDTEHVQTAWILLAELASILKNPATDFAFEVVGGRTFEGEDDTKGACVFRIIQAGFTAGVKDPEGRLERLQEAFPSIKGVATVVEAVRAVLHAFQKTSSTYDFNKWAEDHLYEAVRKLDGLMTEYEDWLRYRRNAPAEEVDHNADITSLESDISFSVRLIAELGKHLGLGKDRKKEQGEYVVIRGVNQCLSLLEKTCDFTGTTGCRPWVRAHGVFALGRLCLGAKQLTWAHSSKFIDLANSRHADIGLRRDAIVVVFDLLKMFGDVIEKDLSKVYGWLGDKCSAIRGDVINHLHDLLLNEHLQWNPAVFYQFLTSISDPSATIREWVRSCLRSLMKKRNQCFTDFSEAVVFLNGCSEHPRFKTTEKLNSQGMAFPLSGKNKVEKRMEVYSFMLKQMTDEQKRITYARILEQILMPVVLREVQIEVHRYYREVLLDVVRILGLKEMEFSVFVKNSEEDENEEETGEEEGDADQAEDEALRKQKLSKAVRKEIWLKFRQEIVQRSLLPVLGSVYRQVRNIPDAPELLTAVVKLVGSLTTEAEIDLAELAQSTSGFDGQILKAMAMDIKRLDVVNTPAPAATPSMEPPPTSATDDIPLIRASPDLMSADIPTPTPTPSTANNTVLSVLSETHREVSSEPPSPKKARKESKNARPKKAKIQPVKEEEVEEEASQPPRKSRRATEVPVEVKERDHVDVVSTVGRKKTRKTKQEPVESPAVSPPPKRSTLAAKRSTTVLKPLDVQQEESGSDLDDTLTSLKPPTNKSRVRGRIADQTQGNLTMGPPRAVSTPNKTRMMDVTFGLDISVIEGAGNNATQRNLRSAVKARGGMK